MKTYTTELQTSRLLGVGFPRPERKHPKWDYMAYSIGELIRFCDGAFKGQNLIIRQTATGWIVGFENTVFNVYDKELVESLVEMCVKLKEAEVI